MPDQLVSKARRGWIGYVAGFALETTVLVLGGPVAAFWFGLGFIVAALLCFYETGNRILAEEADHA